MLEEWKARESKYEVPLVTGRGKVELKRPAVGFCIGRSGMRCALAHGRSRNKFLKPLSGKWERE